MVRLHSDFILMPAHVETKTLSVLLMNYKLFLLQIFFIHDVFLGKKK